MQMCEKDGKAQPVKVLEHTCSTPFCSHGFDFLIRGDSRGPRRVCEGLRSEVSAAALSRGLCGPRTRAKVFTYRSRSVQLVSDTLQRKVLHLDYLCMPDHRISL